jgi:TusA-related sulfurtransferase
MLTEDCFINLRGIPCPINFVRAKLLIDTLKYGEVLKVELDNGEPAESVEKSMIEEGHDILGSEKFESHSVFFIKKN